MQTGDVSSSGFDVGLYVLENQFLKALPQNGGHCRLFSYMDDVGCLDAGGNNRL